MRLTKILIPATALTLTALALATPAQAADLKPRGGALVGVSGGTATAKALSEHRYTLILPEEADISWFGEAKGKGSAPKVGSFTPKQLAKGWTALGHRKGVGVAATLVWQQDGGEASVVVLASDPKVRADGTLALKVFTKQGLPAQLPDYSITVTRAPKASRGFPVYGTGTQVSGSVYVSTDANSANSSSGRIYYGSTKCQTYSHSTSQNKSYDLATNCNGVVINSGSYVIIGQAAPGQCGYDRFSLIVGTGKSKTTMSLTDLTWDVNGNAIAPGQACS